MTETELFREFERDLGNLDSLSGVLEKVEVDLFHAGLPDAKWFATFTLRTLERETETVYWWPEDLNIATDLPLNLRNKSVTMLVSTGHGKTKRVKHLREMWGAEESVPA